MKTNLSDFPDEVLQNILSMCTPIDRNRFRNVCRRFRDVHRDAVLHNYKVICRRIRTESTVRRKNQIASVLRVLYDVNRCFLRDADVRISFYSGATELFKSLHSAVMSSDLIEILNRFYDESETMMLEPVLNMSYLVSLLSLLNRFSNITKSSKRFQSERIHFKHVVHGIWFVIIWCNSSRQLNHPNESRAIVIMLTILLINEKFQRKFYDILEYGTRTMIYGSVTSPSKRSTCCITFEMDIIGDVDIIDYLADTGTCKNVKMPINGGNLTAVNILLKCKEASRLNGGQIYAIRF